MSSPTNCRTCAARLIIKQTQRKAEQLLKPYYYTAYYYCPRCHKMYLSDEFKVTNKNYDLFTQDVLAAGDVDVDIWTDGACSNNGRSNAKAAWAFVAGDYEAKGLVEGKQTNNTAESLAIYFALKWAVEKGYKRIKIHSDSQITLHNLQKPLEKIKVNQDIFAKIFALIQENNVAVYYQKVPAHADNINNNRADKLCNGLVGIK